MAKIYLDSGDNFTVASNNSTVYGTTGTESVTINSGVTGTVLDQNTETVVFNGATSAFTYQQAGNTLKVYSGANLVATIPAQDDANGTLMTFTDGTVSAKLTSGVMNLGGAAVSSTAAGAVTPTTIDTTTKTPVTTTPTTTTPTLSIAAASLTEGNSGTANMTFTATLSAASTTAVTAAYTTTASTATAGTDYTTTSGTLTIAAGATTGTITVPIVGDTTFEANETFTLTLSSPTGATLSTASATGTITNDDSNSAPVITKLTGPLGATVPVTKDTISTAGLMGDFTVTDSDTSLLTFTVSGGAGLVRLTTGASTVAYSNSYASGTDAASISGTASASNLNALLDTIQYTGAGARGSSDTLTVTVSDGTTTTTNTTPIQVMNSALAYVAGVDNLVGNAAADAFNGTGTLAASAIEATDTLSGGDGSDTLFFTAAGTGVALVAAGASITSVENVSVTTNAGGTIVPTLDASLVGGLNNISLIPTSATDAITITNLTNSQVFNLNPTAAYTGGTLTIGNAVGGAAGGTQTVNVNLNPAATSTIVGLSTNADDLHINSSGIGAPTAITTLTLSSSAAKLTLTGGTNFTVAGVATNQVGEIDATGFTGNLTFTNLAGGAGMTANLGSGSDVITGTAGVDSINGGSGNDTFTGLAGNDTMTGGAGNDIFTFSATTTNGKDTITDFTSASDKLDMGAADGTAATVTTIAPGAASATAFATNSAYLINATGAAGSLTTSGSQVLTAADYTAATLTNLATFLAERYTAVGTSTTADVATIVINDTSSGSTTSYVYQWDNDATANVMQAAELSLIGIVQRGSTAIVASDITV